MNPYEASGRYVISGEYEWFVPYEPQLVGEDTPADQKAKSLYDTMRTGPE